jgi:hypothetical protein
VEHLTEPELTGYRKRTLEPDSLLQVTAHLDVCDECRAKLRRLVSAGETLAKMRQSFQSHLTAEQMQCYVDEELDSEARADVERHLDLCAECASDVQALREFAKARPARRWWLGAVAAALVIALGAGVWLLRPAVIAAVNDEGIRIALDARGQVKGIAGLSPRQIESVRRSLRNEALAPAVNLAELQPPGSSLMGSPPAASFHVVAPVGTAVRSSRPELRWTARGPAATYIVTLKNIASGDVISSPPLQTLSWKPGNPLQPGALYAWQVAASVKGREELVPNPPSPQARFLVLDASTVGRLDNLPQSHLVRATLYAEADLLDDAQREAETLEKENPESKIARGLFQRIQGLRPTAP